METIKIKLQSFIDLITNSSTEVFSTVSSGSIEGLYKLFDTILLAGGSNLKSKDIMDISIEYSDSGKDEFYDYIIDLINEKEDKLSAEFNKELDSLTRYSYEYYSLIEKTVENYSKEKSILYSDWCKNYNESGHDYVMESYIKINLKDDSINKESLNIINNLFNYEAYYC